MLYPQFSIMFSIFVWYPVRNPREKRRTLSYGCSDDCELCLINCAWVHHPIFTCVHHAHPDLRSTETLLTYWIDYNLTSRFAHTCQPVSYFDLASILGYIFSENLTNVELVPRNKILNRSLRIYGFFDFHYRTKFALDTSFFFSRMLSMVSMLLLFS